MIFDKIKEKAFIRKNVRVELPEIRNRLQKIRNISSLLAISPTPTKYNWLGVNQATHNMFPNSFFDIPQYYSRSVYNDAELKSIGSIISELNFEKVVFSGYCDYFRSIIEELKFTNSTVFVALIYHGSLSELAGNQKMKNDFSTIINLVKKKQIDRIGFVKKGLDLCINKLFHLNAYPIMLLPPDTSSIIREKGILRKQIHIGVFANNQLRKNVHNQVAAALMIENAQVHVTDKYEYSYFECNERIVEHPSKLPWNEFMFLLSQMDINLYNTYTETWGQIVVESLALGVPCLTNNSSGVLDTSPQLKEKLVVAEHDNPIAIAELMNETLKNKEQIVILGYSFIDKLKQISQQKLDAFLIR